MNPIKVFSIRDEHLIETLEQHMGKVDDDDWKLFPPDLDQLVIICAFNDGTKSPNDHANE